MWADVRISPARLPPPTTPNRRSILTVWYLLLSVEGSPPSSSHELAELLALASTSDREWEVAMLFASSPPSFSPSPGTPPFFC